MSKSKAQLVAMYEGSSPEMDIRKYVVDHLEYKCCIDWSRDELIDEFGYGYCLYMAGLNSTFAYENEKVVQITHADGAQTILECGNIVDLKRKNGKHLKGCVIEDIFEEGFVYGRNTKRGYSYSQVLIEEIEYLRAESANCG